MKAGLTTDRVVNHLDNGGSVLSLAKEFGISSWAVSDIAKRAGVKRRLWQRDGELSDVNRAWVAACIDCEGMVTIHCPWNIARSCRNIQAYIRVNMVNRAVPARLQELCGGTLKYKERVDPKGNRRPQWYWNISANGCRWLLPQIMPFMLEKQRHAEVMLYVLDNNGLSKKMPIPELTAAIQEIRALNTKGMRNRPVVLDSRELRA